MRETPVTVPTLEKPGSEDSCDKLKLDLLQYQLADVGKTLIFNGTGYGLTTMSDTVPLSLKRYGHHISLYNRYQALSSVENEQQVDQTAKQKLVFFMHNILAYVKIGKYFHSNDVGCWARRHRWYKNSKKWSTSRKHTVLQRNNSTSNRFATKKEPQKVNVNGSSMCMNPDWNWDDQAALCIAIAAGSTLFTGAFWQECSESSTVIFHQRIPFAFDRWKISLKYGLLFPVASVIAF